MEFRTDADGTKRERPPHPTGPRPQGPQPDSTNGEAGRPRGSVSAVPLPSKIPAHDQYLIPDNTLLPQTPAMRPAQAFAGGPRIPIELPFVQGGHNFDPMTGRWL